MLFGQQDILHEIIEQFPLLTTDQVSIHHAPEVVGMDEKPIAGIREKRIHRCLWHFNL